VFVVTPDPISMRRHGNSSRARRLTWTARKHGYEQKFRERIGSRKHLPRPVVLHLHCLSFDTGEDQFEAMLTRRKTVRQGEPVVAAHRRRFELQGDGERDGWRFRLATNPPPGSVASKAMSRARSPGNSSRKASTSRVTVVRSSSMSRRP